MKWGYVCAWTFLYMVYDQGDVSAMTDVPGLSYIMLTVSQ